MLEIMEIDLHALALMLHSGNPNCSIHLGRQLHVAFLKKGILNSTLSMANRLLQMYSRCDSMNEACLLFDEMPKRNCFSWSTMIEGYMKSGYKDKSLDLFDIMPQKNDYSWNVVVSGFSKAGQL
ncbi:hypothetical protein L6164_026009 [Bauhinia variegata]|uniref:Uncharacterized protein n=1 Tax=Bauhinia variegata TaxID=167791 RepID=A0ACB9M2L0_BAUVA|nr:hypothetical protein L6164_026009 [Bauhinia variegata]